MKLEKMTVENLKYVDSLIGNKAYMLLNAQLGYDETTPNEPYINGGQFAQSMYDLKRQGYDIVVKINSPGGSVTDGFWINDAIKTTGADTHIIGLAASMAGICALSGRKRMCDDVATIMVHAPSGGDAKYLGMIESNLSTLLDKNTKIPKEKIAEMIKSDKPNWFDSDQMLEMGMVDQVIETQQRFIKPASNNIKDIFKVYNSLNIKPDTTMSLFKTLFKASTDEEAAVNAVQMKGENERLTAKILALETEISALKTKITETENAAKGITVNSLVESAIRDGKIKEEAKVNWIGVATSNFDAAKAALDSIAPPKAKTKSIAAALPLGKVEKDETQTFAFLSKNNPAYLSDLLKSDPEKFEKLLSEHEATKLITA